MKTLEKKKQQVSEIGNKFKECKSSIVTDYRGLTVKQTNMLRAQLRDAGVELVVLKNTITRRATDEAGLAEMNQYLTGPSAITFSMDDVIAPAKILQKFAKENKLLQIKGGVVEGKIVSSEEIKSLAALPSREGLLSMLLSVMQAPVRNFALAVQAIAEKKESEA